MGTEYTLFRSETLRLDTYEMSSRFDLTIYKKTPPEIEECDHDRDGFTVAIEFYDETMAPEELARMGIACLRTAFLQLDPKLELTIARELAEAVPEIFRRINEREVMKLSTRKHRTISILSLIERAGSLVFVHGESPEYERALVDLVRDAANLPPDTDRAEVEAEIRQAVIRQAAIRQEAARRS